MDKLNQKKIEELREKLQKQRPGFVKVGVSSCGIAAGANDVLDRFIALKKKNNLDIEIRKCGCAGMCYAEPLVEVSLDGRDSVTYKEVTPELVEKIVKNHIISGKIQEDYVYKTDTEKKQFKLILSNCGKVNPESINDYISLGGYRAVEKVLIKENRQEVIDQLKISGLRGRGGGGFPTWLKWNFAKGVNADKKYIICNGDEGDPGAYMDRSLLEGNPHAIIEGMIIAGFAVGADEGFFYIRAEYPLAISRVQKAIDAAIDYGLLGENILDTGFNFNLQIRLGAGAFVCGEETALIASIEGKRGYPSPRPPYPSVKGLWSKPTVINNVETLANIPIIFDKGGDWFSKIGSQNSKGTKVFALTGKVKNSGLVEVPMGTTLGEIVYGIGGGVSGGKVKAIQTGGPSGGVIPKEYFDTPVNYESLQKLGSIMGSGGMIVMDEKDCMVDIAKFYMKFCVEEACGKCSPGRIGTYQMLQYLKKISKGKANMNDLQLLEDIAYAVQRTALCGLGQTAPNPVVSTLKYFRDEYIAHIKEQRCPAGKCKDLAKYKIVEDKCKKCGACIKVCPVEAISGDKDKGYKIDQKKCIQCGKCFQVCSFDAIKKG
ncbi:MAG: 4Fe-4S binding protein [Candidatus Omnitrophica bacterium]|nr:4Fe-4S binding protein [Candidatus Omnitrophota bacterium]MCF7893547.1 4Fe-4S binding protein [Candidatus Omnitrophota bacterium]